MVYTKISTTSSACFMTRFQRVDDSAFETLEVLAYQCLIGTCYDTLYVFTSARISSSYKWSGWSCWLPTSPTFSAFTWPDLHGKVASEVWASRRLAGTWSGNSMSFVEEFRVSGVLPILYLTFLDSEERSGNGAFVPRYRVGVPVSTGLFNHTSRTH